MPTQEFFGSTSSFGSEGITGGDIEPADVRSAPLHKGLTLWRELRGSRLFPSRQQMTPRALGSLLRNTMLAKVLNGGREFQLRVIGDAIMTVQNDSLQGMTTAEVEKVLPRYGEMLRRNYSVVCTLKAPRALRGKFCREVDNRVFYREHLMLPLGETDAAVDHIISLIVYTQPFG